MGEKPDDSAWREATQRGREDQARKEAEELLSRRGSAPSSLETDEERNIRVLQEYQQAEAERHARRFVEGDDRDDGDWGP